MPLNYQESTLSPLLPSFAPGSSGVKHISSIIPIFSSTSPCFCADSAVFFATRAATGRLSVCLEPFATTGKGASMYVGTDYYPEHWPRSRWKTDLALMKKGGFNVVRLAEFDWVGMEPAEGEYCFEMLGEVLPLLRKHGISAILCTPTAVMPAWVAEKYPDVLHVNNQGVRETWGVRKNNCLTNRTYRHLSQQITLAMAREFGSNPTVIGWQTDNEFGHPFWYCNLCRSDFQDFLKRKYVTLDELNRAWGTHFWGHRIQEWCQITLPVNTGTHNPSAALDWHRYFSFQNVRFQHEQVEILRAHTRKQFITHNLMGLFPEINYYEFSKDLDFVSWDNYPVWGKPFIRHSSGFTAALMRGVKKKNFWIMEQTAGPGGWGSFGRNVRPGELRNIAYQQLAHGCDGQVWFRWRTCSAGREQYWHGLLGHDGRALRRYHEAAQTAHEYHRLAPCLEQTTVKTPIAFIYDYDSLWASRIQPGFPENDYARNIDRYYEAIFRAGCSVDVISPEDSFAPYRLILAPGLYVLPDTVARRITAFVQDGGVFLTDMRAAVKDATGLCHERTLPGMLSEMLGITIEEYESIDKETPCELEGTDAFPGSFTVEHYADWLQVTTAQALTGYRTPYMRPFTNCTRNRYGKGYGWYVGAPVREEAFYDQVIAGVLADANVRGPVQPPLGVEVGLRQGKGKKILFLINHTEEPKTVSVPKGKTELLGQTTTGGSLELAPFGVAVIDLATK